MAARMYQTSQNRQNVQVKGKKVDRSSRRILGELTLNTKNPICNKKTLVRSISKGKKPQLCKAAVRRFDVPSDDNIASESVPSKSDELVLPSGVIDIDEDDSNPQLCSEYAKETFVYLKQLELRAAVKPDFLNGCPTTEKMRAVLVDWLIEVQIQFNLVQETLFLSIDMIDRYLNIEGKDVHRSRLQLVGVAAMFLASKIEEVYAPAISDFVYITDNTYTDSEIRNMEMKILCALDFGLCKPVSLNFLRRYSKAGDVDVLQHSLAKYVLEISLLDYNLVPVPGSLLASASLCFSLLILDPSISVDNVWSPTLQYYSGDSAVSVLRLVVKLASNVVKMYRSCKLQAVRNKYKSGKYMQVADHVELRFEKIVELANA